MLIMVNQNPVNSFYLRECTKEHKSVATVASGVGMERKLSFHCLPTHFFISLLL